MTLPSVFIAMPVHQPLPPDTVLSLLSTQALLFGNYILYSLANSCYKRSMN